jgi:hypothetical protein
MCVPVYKIIRIYQVPAKDQIEATNRMMQAIALRVERDFHVMDYIKSPDDGLSKGTKANLEPPKGWVAGFLEQLFGTASKKR